MDLNSSKALLAVGAAVLLLWLSRRTRQPSDTLRPPGPAGLPLVGNLFQIPLKGLGTGFKRLVDQYGPFVSLRVGPMNILIVGDDRLAHELLDVRAGNYSARMRLHYLDKHLDPECLIWTTASDKAMVAFGRKLSAEAMRRVKQGQTSKVSEYEALIVARQCLSDPSGWMHHIERSSISSTMTLAYGASCPTGKEPSIQILTQIMNDLNREAEPQASLVNFLPFLDRLPGPKPWRRRGLVHQRLTASFFEEVLKSHRPDGDSSSKYWSDIFSRAEGGLPLLFMLILGNSETTSIAAQNLVLASLIRGGEFVAALQQQIDEVVGSERLPQFSDQSKLPLVEALTREVLRWRPPAPTGLPHVSLKDDVVEYEGKRYFIPGGTFVFAAPNAIEHDPKRYDSPEIFNPRRFLDEKGQLLPNYYPASVFGYGRRACSGRPLAERSLWITAATLLWAFNFRKVPGVTYSDGPEAYTDQVSSRPFELPVIFEPRDEPRAKVLEQVWNAHPKDPEQLL